MPKITLVCSGHQENGLCNAGELLKILHDIKPEAAFLEMRPSEFDMFYAHGSVEAHAVSRYREFKEVQPVPVDGYHASGNHLAEIKRVFDGVIDYVTDASHEYRQLTEEQFDNVFHLGFPYLDKKAMADAGLQLADANQRSALWFAEYKKLGGKANSPTDVAVMNDPCK